MTKRRTEVVPGIHYLCYMLTKCTNNIQINYSKLVNLTVDTAIIRKEKQEERRSDDAEKQQKPNKKYNIKQTDLNKSALIVVIIITPKNTICPIL